MSKLEFYYRGRWAITRGLENLGLNEGDNVLFQAYTCVAVPKGILAAKMVPFIIDVEPRSLFVNPKVLERVLVRNKIKCFIVQHTFGFICPNEIFEVCRKHNVKILEDCAHLFLGFERNLTKYKEGDARVFSLEWGKPIPVGLGGVLEIKNGIKVATAEESNYLNWLKIEIQYLVFSWFYRSSYFFFLKRVFSLLKGSILLEDNGMKEESLHEDFDELNYKISPMVYRRFKRQLAFLQRNDKVHRDRLNGFVNQFLNYRELDKLALDFTESIPLRIPVMVNNKAEVLKDAASVGIPLGDWYDSPIDPLSGPEISKIQNESDLLVSSWELSSHVVTIPLDRIQNKNLMEKTLVFLKQRTFDENQDSNRL